MAEYAFSTKQTIKPQRLLGLIPTAFDVEAGKTFKVETSPEGVELLSETVPAGKLWKVTLRVDVVEVNEEDA